MVLGSDAGVMLSLYTDPLTYISKYLFLAHYYPKLKQSKVFLHPWWLSSFYSSMFYYPPNLLYPLFWYIYCAVESLWFIICFISKIFKGQGLLFLGIDRTLYFSNMKTSFFFLTHQPHYQHQSSRHYLMWETE